MIMTSHLIMYSLKINEINQFSQAGVIFYSTQLLLKITTFELNYSFVFHRIWAIDIQLRLEFLQLIYDFLTSNKTVTTSFYMFSIVRFLLWKCGRMAKALRCSLVTGVRRADSNPVLHRRSLWIWMSRTEVLL